MSIRSSRYVGIGKSLVASVVLSAVTAGPVLAAAEATVSPAFSTWDAGDPAADMLGSSRLVRIDAGLKASFHASDLPAGHAVTLWIVVFNNPGACATSPCGLADLLDNEAAESDFLWGAGKIVDPSGEASFTGFLRVGDASRSAFHELDMPAKAVGLTDPRGAEVHLMLHSHGPVVTGRTLRHQLKSFTGGCEVFLGPDGIAAGPGDIPSEPGECSTFQVSVHP